MHWIIEIETESPPHATTWMDGVAGGALLFLECVVLTCIILLIRRYKSQQKIAPELLMATACMCIGAGIQTLATFVSNAHLYSSPWMEAIRNFDCSFWDFLMIYSFGFATWYYGLVTRQIYWYKTIRLTFVDDVYDGVEDGMSADGRDENKSGKMASGYSMEVLEDETSFDDDDDRDAKTSPTADSNSSAINSSGNAGNVAEHTSEYTFVRTREHGATISPEVKQIHSYYRRVAIAALIVIFGSAIWLALAAEFGHGSHFIDELDSCYATPLLKSIVITWLILAIITLAVTTAMLKGKTQGVRYMRYTTGINGTITLIKTCIVALLVLMTLNTSGLLVYSSMRSVYLVLLVLMFTYSIIFSMQMDSRVGSVRKDLIEQSVGELTFSRAWGYPVLKEKILSYVGSSAQTDLRTRRERICLDIDPESWPKIESQIHTEIIHPIDALIQRVNVPSVKEDVDHLFVIEASDDEDLDHLNDDQPVDLESQSLSDASSKHIERPISSWHLVTKSAMSSIQLGRGNTDSYDSSDCEDDGDIYARVGAKASENSISRCDMVNFIRDADRIFINLKMNTPSEVNDTYQSMAAMIQKYFPSRQSNKKAHPTHSETSLPHVLETTDAHSFEKMTIECPSADEDPDLMVVHENDHDEGHPDVSSGMPPLPTHEQLMRFNEMQCDRLMSSGMTLPYGISDDDFRELYSEQCLVKHVIPVHMRMLKDVLIPLKSIDVRARVEIMIRFIQFVRMVCTKLVEVYYFPTCIARTPLYAAYEQILRAHEQT